MKIEYSDHAARIFKKLDKQIQKRIKSYLDEIEKLADPRSRGKGLTADKAGLWRYGAVTRFISNSGKAFLIFISVCSFCSVPSVSEQIRYSSAVLKP
ncbi:hypothetical protein V1L52_04270 [Treponema sp. HNW]|uniref:type II toxin-antitoxin system RelE family toxin n=1 Tax=Treponema sp. HNW TaxID=3116654 RepID=UPI003D120FFC